ncbi:MAG: tyrosine decarboxylase MfnA [Candidatus Lokiarchaeota archaeon]|nr:tyrosine decarboxylase MfnA [Candidatus Lokiarchaeota archaeon]
MQEFGLSKEDIISRLGKLLKDDKNYDSGKILGSMCTKPLSLAIKIYQDFFDKNLGDPGLFPATWAIERDVIKMISTLLNNPKGVGYCCSGGTEANLIAMRMARNSHDIKHPEIIVPISAHASFDKAADLMNLHVIKVPLNEQYQADVEAVKSAISENTIAIVGIAGTTSLGVIDPIKELNEISLNNDIYLHVDAAFGGLVLPFLRKLGHKIPDFDFKLEGVRSITTDPHKMGMSPIGTGGIIFRDSSIMRENSYEIPYLAGGNFKQATIIGTRQGASVIATWAIFKYLGINGYAKIVKKCMNLTNILAKGIEKIDEVSLVIDPVINIVGFKSESLDINKIDHKLRKRGWALGGFPEFLRVVVMPHIRKCHIDSFLSDLEDITHSMKSKKVEYRSKDTVKITN